ncbi:glutathione transferase [Scheffersomyces coipomensis]|uniref:glutathione transferase n=1 Tax=Scheffersomyces coipomensis TaxID=1788519 RepID=UPI00315C6ECA
MSLKIYDWPTGPFPARVRIALAEKGLLSKVEFERVNLWKAEHKSAEFKQKFNYSGTVPVLELEDGTIIAEVNAIITYLDNLDDNQFLTGRTAAQKGVILNMTRRAELEVQEAISTYFHNSTPGLGPQVEIYQNKEWGIYQLEKGLRGLRHFDDVLQNQPYVAGDEFSMADIALIGGMLFVSVMNIEVPSDLKALLAWYKKVQERPSVKQQADLGFLDGSIL